MGRDTRFHAAATIIAQAQSRRAFPGAVIEVGTPDGVLWEQAFGSLTYDPSSPITDLETVFDLASLTKVLATTPIAMRLVETGRIRLDDPVSGWSPGWREPDRRHATVEHLLAHASGLPAWLDLFRESGSPAEIESVIAAVPLEHEPGLRSIYSDLGFMLLAFILERAAGNRRLNDLFAEVITDLLGARAREGEPDKTLIFNPPPGLRERIAPTEIDPWRGRLLVGEVHDENAWALGGVAGHAGLFGTAAAVGDVARAILGAYLGRRAVDSWPRRDTVHRFVSRTSTPASSRALGWDTMLPTSSCGTLMSPPAFGHTGFTGTSLWIDPMLGVYVVFLTNRVHPTRQNEMIRTVRPAVHDEIVKAVLSGA